MPKSQKEIKQKEIKCLEAKINGKAAKLREEASKSQMCFKKIGKLAQDCLDLKVQLTNLRRAKIKHSKGPADNAYVWG